MVVDTELIWYKMGAIFNFIRQKEAIMVVNIISFLLGKEGK